MLYDADKTPDPEVWSAINESDRIRLVMDYHRKARLPVGENARFHAAVHVVVEDQIALENMTAVPETLDRLMREGLGRHDAIHAVGSAMMGIIFDVVREKNNGSDVDAKYGRELAALTAASWRSHKD
jgi:hypothetical protein